MLDRLLISVGILVAVFVLYHIAIRVKYKVWGTLALAFTAITMVTISLGFLINWVITSNITFASNIMIYPYATAVFFGAMYCISTLHDLRKTRKAQDDDDDKLPWLE